MNINKLVFTSNIVLASLSLSAQQTAATQQDTIKILEINEDISNTSQDPYLVNEILGPYSEYDIISTKTHENIDPRYIKQHMKECLLSVNFDTITGGSVYSEILGSRYIRPEIREHNGKEKKVFILDVNDDSYEIKTSWVNLTDFQVVDSKNFKLKSKKIQEEVKKMRYPMIDEAEKNNTTIPETDKMFFVFVAGKKIFVATMNDMVDKLYNVYINSHRKEYNNGFSNEIAIHKIDFLFTDKTIATFSLKNQ